MISIDTNKDKNMAMLITAIKQGTTFIPNGIGYLLSILYAIQVEGRLFDIEKIINHFTNNSNCGSLDSFFVNNKLRNSYFCYHIIKELNSPELTGRKHENAVSYNKIIDILSNAGAADPGTTADKCIHELKRHKLILVNPDQRTSSGIGSISVSDYFCMKLDIIFTYNDPKKDVIELIKYSKNNSSGSTKAFKIKYNWPTRRINSALKYLEYAGFCRPLSTYLGCQYIADEYYINAEALYYLDDFNEVVENSN